MANQIEQDRIFVKFSHIGATAGQYRHSVEAARELIDSQNLCRFGEAWILVNGKVVAHKKGDTWL